MNSERAGNQITDGGAEGIQTEGATGTGFLGRGSYTGKDTYFYASSLKLMSTLSKIFTVGAERHQQESPVPQEEGENVT